MAELHETVVYRKTEDNKITSMLQPFSSPLSIQHLLRCKFRDPSCQASAKHACGSGAVTTRTGVKPGLDPVTFLFFIDTLQNF